MVGPTGLEEADHDRTMKICPGGCGGMCDIGAPHCGTCTEDDVAAETLSRKRYAAWKMERHACRDHAVDGVCPVCLEYDRTHGRAA